MQTVNFQCGGCNKLMAVSSEFLGRQVRCPHCQAVVTAPTQAAPAPAPAALPPDRSLTETLFAPPPSHEHEDIFAPPEPTDDLFGRAEAPRLEFPPPAPVPVEAPPDPPPAPLPDPLGATLSYAPPPGAADPDATETDLPPGGAAAPWQDGTTLSTAPPPADAGAEELAAAIPKTTRRSGDGGGWFIALVFIPLISYSILATIAIIALWYQVSKAPPHPLEFVPDVNPDDTDPKTHLVGTLKFPKETATLALPPQLHVALGQTLHLGDLEFTPEKVEPGKVRVVVQGSRPEEMEHPCLILRLRLRNASSNVVFKPMETYFNRQWKGGNSSPPLTQVELGSDRRLFGGPAEFHPRGNATVLPQWVEGDHYDAVLHPGEEMETFVCTDGSNAATWKAIEQYHGPILYRVHVRRGVVAVPTLWAGLIPISSNQKPAAAVVGVEFADQDWRKNTPAGAE